MGTELKSKVMKKAWAIARKGAARFGRKVRVYFASALRLAWREVKATTMPLADLAEEIYDLWGVESANAWEKYGKRRIYIELTKFNGGKNWNGGIGYALYYDADARKLVEVRGWAGAATRNIHERTLAAIRELLGL